MKKTLFCIILLLLWTLPVLADEVDDKLGNMATEQQRIATRAMINANVDPEGAIQMTRAMIQNQFRNRYTLRAQQVVMEAKEENLPVEPVMNKAFEGIAKKAPDEAVVQAMETVLERYVYAYGHAYSYTRQKAYQRQIGNAIAEAMTAGLETGEVDQLMTQLQLRQQQRDRQRNLVNIEEFALESFQAARDMMRVGVPSNEVGGVIGQAVQQNSFTESDMKQMRRRFREQVVLVDPEELAREYSRSIREGAEPGSNSAGSGPSDGAAASGSSGGSDGSGAGGSGDSGDGEGHSGGGK